MPQNYGADRKVGECESLIAVKYSRAGLPTGHVFRSYMLHMTTISAITSHR